MRPWALTLALAALSAGCTVTSLERNTLGQGESAADLRYREVMHDLAALAANPAVLPAYSSIYAGTTKVSDTGTLGSTTVIGREILKNAASVTHFQQETLDVMGQRQVADNWSLDPVSGPEKLRAMRCACLWVLNGREALCPECLALLGSSQQFPTVGHHFDVAKELEALPPGWLGVSGCKDVPRDACYKAHCHDSWVWVTREGMEGLSGFTLVLQNIARRSTDSTYYPPAQTRTVTKQLEVSEGKGQPTDTVKVTAYVDASGRLVSGLSAYAYPVKRRIDNIGSDPFTRSQIAAATATVPSALVP